MDSGVAPTNISRGSPKPGSKHGPGRPARLHPDDAPSLDIVLAKLRTAKFGEMPHLAMEFGLSLHRLQYLRYRILAMTFSADDRRRWTRAQRQLQKSAPKRLLIPKREGIARADYFGDWTVQEQDALLRLRQAQIAERMSRPDLIAKAKAGDIPALLRLKQKYRLRLPLVEAGLPAEARRFLPWLTKGNGDE